MRCDEPNGRRLEDVGVIAPVELETLTASLRYLVDNCLEDEFVKFLDKREKRVVWIELEIVNALKEFLFRTLGDNDAVRSATRCGSDWNGPKFPEKDKIQY